MSIIDKITTKVTVETPNTASPIEPVVMCITEKDARKFARIIFTHAYSLGAFSGNNDKKEKGYGMMLEHMIDKDVREKGVKELLEALYT